MYFYLLMAAAIVFGIWFTWSIPKGSLGVKQRGSKLGQWGGIVRIFVVAAVILGAIIGTSNHAARCAKSGLAAYNQGRYAEAEADLGRAEDFDPSNAAAHYYRAECLLHDGNKREALSEFHSVCSVVFGRRYTSSQSTQLAQEAQARIQQLDAKP